jgi:hypothetical protein
MPRLDGITVIAVVLVASFAIDRIVTGALFLLSFSDRWTRRFPDPDAVTEPVERVKARNRQKLLYFCFAAVLALPVLAGYGRVRILAALGFPTNAVFDVILTGLLLVGGSDRVADILKLPGARGADKSEPKPITIQGTLVVEDKGTSREAPAGQGGLPPMFT